jgi:alpha-glucosidase
MALLLLALPGAAYVYQGQELGLPNVDDLPDGVLQDPIWERSGHTVRGRDGCRVPLPWSGERPPFGFSAAASTWLPQPAGWAGLTVAAQAAEPASMLSLYRSALRLRREHRALGRGELRWVEGVPDDVLALDLVGDSETIRIVANFSRAPVQLPDGDCLLSSAPLDGGRLPAEAAAWVAPPERAGGDG